jgi:hypothetical protein
MNHEFSISHITEKYRSSNARTVLRQNKDRVSYLALEGIANGERTRKREREREREGETEREMLSPSSCKL